MPLLIPQSAKATTKNKFVFAGYLAWDSLLKLWLTALELNWMTLHKWIQLINRAALKCNNPWKSFNKILIAHLCALLSVRFVKGNVIYCQIQTVFSRRLKQIFPCKIYFLIENKLTVNLFIKFMRARLQSLINLLFKDPRGEWNVEAAWVNEYTKKRNKLVIVKGHKKVTYFYVPRIDLVVGFGSHLDE